MYTLNGDMIVMIVEQFLDLITVEIILRISTILFFSFIGSFAKDYLKIIHDPNKNKFNIIEIFLSTMTAFIVVFTISEYIENWFTVKGLLGFSFLLGLLGFELLNRLSTINGIGKFIGACLKFYKLYVTSSSLDDSNPREHKK